MKITAKKITWMSVACALSILSGAPAVADDTELLLVTPGNNDNPFNANIMLIIDSSGSMSTLEQTTLPYDSTQTYAGTCDTNLMYWISFDVVPVCDGNNTQSVDKISYVCKSSERQIAGVGLFSDTMVQYRSDDSGGSSRWIATRIFPSVGKERRVAFPGPFPACPCPVRFRSTKSH